MKSSATAYPGLFRTLEDSSLFGSKSIMFVHNWRSAGTSLHSLLRSNLHSFYLKIGDQQDYFGRPIRNAKLASQSATLKFLRAHLRPSSVVAGHTFVGLDSFFYGEWDYWMNFRAPIERLRSGLLRFHSIDTSNGNPRGYDLIHTSESLNSPEDVRRLLAGPLIRECNGMSRRLAAMSLSTEFTLDGNASLERCSILDRTYDDLALFKAAQMQLKRIKLILLADQLMASVACMEKLYKLPPLINPFTTLHHNSSAIIGYSDQHLECLEQSEAVIKSSQRVDLALWPVIQARFNKQIQVLGVNKHDVAVKEVIHAKSLFSYDWLSGSLSEDQVLQKMAKALASRCLSKPKLAQSILQAVCSWSVFTPAASKMLYKATSSLLPSIASPAVS